MFQRQINIHNHVDMFTHWCIHQNTGQWRIVFNLVYFPINVAIVALRVINYSNALYNCEYCVLLGFARTGKKMHKNSEDECPFTANSLMRFSGRFVSRWSFSNVQQPWGGKRQKAELLESKTSWKQNSNDCSNHITVYPYLSHVWKRSVAVMSHELPMYIKVHVSPYIYGTCARFTLFFIHTHTLTHTMCMNT